MSSQEQKPEAFVRGAAKLTDIFGRWPTLHDASAFAVEVSGPNTENCPTKSVQLVLLTCEMTGEVDEKGYFKQRKHTAVVLRFHDVSELDLARFGDSNVLFGMQLTPGPEGIRVVLDSAMGGDMAGSLRCNAIEVVEARPCPANADAWLDDFVTEHRLSDS